MTPVGLPHSEICGSMLTCSSPQLIAAYRVLLRFETPRHPPYALTCLTYVLHLLVFSLYPNLLGKIYSVLFYLSVEDLSEENFMT